MRPAFAGPRVAMTLDAVACGSALRRRRRRGGNSSAAAQAATAPSAAAAKIAPPHPTNASEEACHGGETERPPERLMPTIFLDAGVAGALRRQSPHEPLCGGAFTVRRGLALKTAQFLEKRSMPTLIEAIRSCMLGHGLRHRLDTYMQSPRTASRPPRRKRHRLRLQGAGRLQVDASETDLISSCVDLSVEVRAFAGRQTARMAVARMAPKPPSASKPIGRAPAISKRPSRTSMPCRRCRRIPSLLPVTAGTVQVRCA